MNSAFQPGRRVQVTSIPDWLLHDLPAEDQRRLLDQKGCIVEIRKLLPHGYLWLSFADGTEGFSALPSDVLLVDDISISMDSAKLGQAFLDRTPIAGVWFSHRDTVSVVAGSHTGAIGELLTIIALQPEPKFVVETSLGIDIEVLQSEIERL
ncbi:hypothetical protein [Denitromonas ohlonensis]|uniref:Uncharacterized protein n=2 Tax=Denitromonas TaxID=139331 RepID=A0A557RKW0_9RHOO|nr:hypothetical protein [Denitromonas ohlonensis]TVO65752.1 hypothetical protein FHP90_09675 [Denitromonas ohlonensis]TVO79345.1 hypothetical protein FHP89_00860 [Denitromonas ohlonensis]